MSDFQTEYPFELPKGYIDANGTIHKRGVMRLATAADEIVPMKDPRVQQNAGYLSIIVLSRVITALGDLRALDTTVIERLFTADLMFLQDMYQKINLADEAYIEIICPACNQQVKVGWPFSGE